MNTSSPIFTLPVTYSPQYIPITGALPSSEIRSGSVGSLKLEKIRNWLNKGESLTYSGSRKLFVHLWTLSINVLDMLRKTFCNFKMFYMTHTIYRKNQLYVQRLLSTSVVASSWFIHVLDEDSVSRRTISKSSTAPPCPSHRFLDSRPLVCTWNMNCIIQVIRNLNSTFWETVDKCYT